ncbi:hypothetical protein GCM10011499_24900 [Pelagibacterium lentulum]|uniref:Uncharacterized protein n=1 Tax=Pelagibacterium lentulum TaxID=2029865 RepID=A0A916VZ80_9HYPH|nr:hypothetical protein GCM10011499_24900 [Pelagibacterium lentulum]
MLKGWLNNRNWGREAVEAQRPRLARFPKSAEQKRSGRNAPICDIRRSAN